MALSGLPRVGLYHGYPGNSDEGWTRYVFDTFKVPYKQLHDDEVRAGNLKDSYDTIILPDASYSSMLNGARAGSLPAKYTGGMTQAGVDNLKAFVQAGGTLVAINDATQLPIRAFAGFPLTDVTAGVPSTGYYSPGSILAGLVDNKNPLTWGMGDTADLYSDGSPAFSVNAGATGVDHAGHLPDVERPAQRLAAGRERDRRQDRGRRRQVRRRPRGDGRRQRAAPRRVARHVQAAVQLAAGGGGALDPPRTSISRRSPPSWSTWSVVCSIPK